MYPIYFMNFLSTISNNGEYYSKLSVFLETFKLANIAKKQDVFLAIIIQITGNISHY